MEPVEVVLANNDRVTVRVRDVFLKIDTDQERTDGDEVTGIIDWSEASQGDALFDLATLTLAHEEHLDDVLAGYDTDVARDLIRAWQSWRCLVAVRWLFENGYGPPEQYPEVAVLRSHS